MKSCESCELWKLVIDARERIPCDSYFTEHPSKKIFNIEKRNLDIGDFLIKGRKMTSNAFYSVFFCF